MLGFVNGLAIVIGLAQIRQFQTMDKQELHWMTGDMMSLFHSFWLQLLCLLYGLHQRSQKLSLVH